MADEHLIFIKLGGSLITDKRQRATARKDVIRQLARELRKARQLDPKLRVVLGHGSGSFGHWEANKYKTHLGVQSPEQWEGFARVSAAAQRLNRIVVQEFQHYGVPVMSLQPSASIIADNREIRSYNLETLTRVLDKDLVPLIYGDVVLDNTLGGTIFSTEDLFVYLAQKLHPQRILLLGNSLGVLNDDGSLIKHITPDNLADVAPHLHASIYTDVTGGMADKVATMLDLVQRVPALKVWILTGRTHGFLLQAILEPDNTPGTLITSQIK